MSARYDTIGEGYADRRHADPRIARRLHDALGRARTVVNVGAGTGSYEPTDRPVVAVEPSATMAAQRPASLGPAVLGVAEELPFADDAADAVMGVLTLHHWQDAHKGVEEAKRVARDRVVLLTIDPRVSAGLWLADYFPDVAFRDAAEFPPIDDLLDWLGAGATSTAVPVPSDCADGFLLSFWCHPERVLDPGARRATSGFARLDPDAEARGLGRLADDLSSGAWDRRHGSLRALREHDCGLQLVATA